MNRTLLAAALALTASACTLVDDREVTLRIDPTLSTRNTIWVVADCDPDLHQATFEIDGAPSGAGPVNVAVPLDVTGFRGGVHRLSARVGGGRPTPPVTLDFELRGPPIGTGPELIRVTPAPSPVAVGDPPFIELLFDRPLDPARVTRFDFYFDGVPLGQGPEPVLLGDRRTVRIVPPAALRDQDLSLTWTATNLVGGFQTGLVGPWRRFAIAVTFARDAYPPTNGTVDIGFDAAVLGPAPDTIEFHALPDAGVEFLAGTAPLASGHFSWDTRGVPEGSYTLVGRGPPSFVVAPGLRPFTRVVVDRTGPTLLCQASACFQVPGSWGFSIRLSAPDNDLDPAYLFQPVLQVNGAAVATVVSGDLILTGSASVCTADTYATPLRLSLSLASPLVDVLGNPGVLSGCDVQLP